MEQVIGTHGDLPIQSLSLSHDKSLLVSSSHDEFVKFWSVPQVGDMSVEPHKKRSGKKTAQYQKLKERKAFFDDL